MELSSLTEQELNDLYNWIDQIPLSRPKKNIARDFADACQTAEIINYFFPQLVELHNYAPANSVQQKTYNWTTLNQKVFKKLGFMFSNNDIQAVINCTPNAIEKILFVLKQMIEKRQQQLKSQKEIQDQKKNSQFNMNKEDQISDDSQQQISQQYSGIHKKMLQEKDQTISELAETVQILELKIQKLEQLVTLKDNKIHTLVNKLAQRGQ